MSSSSWCSCSVVVLSDATSFFCISPGNSSESLEENDGGVLAGAVGSLEGESEDGLAGSCISTIAGAHTLQSSKFPVLSLPYLRDRGERTNSTRKRP